MCVLSSLLVGIGLLCAQSNVSTTPDWDTNLTTPEVPAKASAAVARHMDNISKWFKSKGLSTKTVRNNEVLVVTIPASELFTPNSTDLIDGATTHLNAFEPAIEHPESYRILIAVHTDDTGDNTYSNKFTKERAEVIMETFESIARHKSVKPNIYYYWFGSKRPTVENNSIKNRAQNRRIEFYIVPESRTIEGARSGNFSKL